MGDGGGTCRAFKPDKSAKWFFHKLSLKKNLILGLFFFLLLFNSQEIQKNPLKNLVALMKKVGVYINGKFEEIEKLIGDLKLYF